MPDHASHPNAITVAIFGGGPAGATLAVLLAQRGYRVVLYDDGRRPDLIVGESLVPALVPIFRKLGIEEEVAAIGKLKPGVSFYSDRVDALHLSFKSLGNVLPNYAYNVPRPAFDDLLRSKAHACGAHVCPFIATVEKAEQVAGSPLPALKLSDDTLAKSPALEGRQPDLIVDCTGRMRTIARLLDLPTKDGPRNDVARFAHFRGADMTGLPEGQVLTSIMEHGWSWCIPLRDRQSIGVVMHNDKLKHFGSTPEEQLRNVMASNPTLAERTANAQRITDVVSYSNYQKITAHAFGPNWVLLGDALGFVDPLFSPGLFMAMHTAIMFSEALDRSVGVSSPRRKGDSPLLTQRGARRSMQRFSREAGQWLEAWWKLVELVYSGELFALRESGVTATRNYPNRGTIWFSKHMEQNVAAMASGETTRSRYPWALIYLGLRFGLRDQDPERYRIR